MELISLKNDREKAVPQLISLCETAMREPRRIEQCKLFSTDEWWLRPETLLHKTLVQEIFQDGDYYMLLDGEQVVCGAGFYPMSEHISHVMYRMWTHPGYRARWIGHQILERQHAEMATFFGIISFNDVNKSLYDKMAAISQTTPGETWPGLWRRFTPLGQIKINNVQQHCLMIAKEYANP